LRAENGTLAKTINGLSSELGVLRDSYEAQQVANRDLETRNSTLASDIEDLNADIRALRDNYASEQAANRDLASENQRQSDEIIRVNQDRLDVEERNASLTDTLTHQQAVNREIQTSLEQHARRLRHKNLVVTQVSTQLVEMRSALKGASELAARWHRVPGQQKGGGHYVGSLRADSGTEHRIGIDVMSIQFGVSGGVEVYMRTLVRSLISNPRIGVILVCLADQLEYLQRRFGDQVSYYIFSASPLVRIAKRFEARWKRQSFTQTTELTPSSFARLREEAGVHVLHCPVQCYSLFDFTVPAIFHLHDLQHLHFPENFRPSDIEARNHLYGMSADLSEFIIATSNFVKDDIVARMHVPPQKVKVIPATWDPAVEEGAATFGAEDARQHYKLPPQFALYPAQFWPHKNHARLVEALAIVRSTLPVDFKLVFTGNRQHSGWPLVAETIERLNLGDHIQCLDYVPTQHLGGLYKAANFCVMPSTFEASSYPVIEAQLLGCPVMCSHVTSLPELMVGDAGLLFDPFNPQDIADKMLYWIRNPEEAAHCAERASLKVRREHGMDSYTSAIGSIYDEIKRSGA